MKGNRKLVMNLGGIQGNPEKPQQKGNGNTNKDRPPCDVEKHPHRLSQQQN